MEAKNYIEFGAAGFGTYRIELPVNVQSDRWVYAICQAVMFLSLVEVDGNRRAMIEEIAACLHEEATHMESDDAT